MAKMKPYDELNFTDDFMFCKVMRQEEICKRIIEIILGVKIKAIRTFDSQHAIEITANGRGVRLDVIVNDDEGTIYNIEMQASPENEYGKRSRYYQGMIDLETMSRGSKYEELRKSYIIFLCSEDPFGEKRAVYTFENRCAENTSLRLEDDAYKVFVKPYDNNDDYGDDLRAFFDYLKTATVSDELTQQIDEEVKKARTHEEWRAEYMLMGIKLKETEEKAKKEGLEEGRKKEIIRTMKRMLEKGSSIKEIADFYDFSEEKVREYINQ